MPQIKLLSVSIMIVASAVNAWAKQVFPSRQFQRLLDYLLQPAYCRDQGGVTLVQVSDIVISQRLLTQNWAALYNEVRQFRDACGDAHLKTIWPLVNGNGNVTRASLIMMAGADFIKTSAGKENVVGPPISLVMVLHPGIL